MGLQLVDGVA